MSVEQSLRSIITPGISKRSDFPLRPTSMALLVIDIQRELTDLDAFSTEYKHAVSFHRMITNTKRLIEIVRANRELMHNKAGGGSEIIFTYLQALTDDSRDVSLDYKLSGGVLSNLPNPSNPATFLHGIAPIPGKDIALPKTSCSVFQSTNIDYILRNLNVEQLVVCGQLTDQCVESAVRDAADLGYLVSVVQDACGAESEESHLKGLAGMKGFARIVTATQVISELCGNNDNSALREPSTNEIEKHEEPVRICSLQSGLTIPLASEYRRSHYQGSQAAIVRSLRAANVQFIRYAIVDAYNTIRCKSVPLDRAFAQLPSRTHKYSTGASNDGPLDVPVSIAEVCFAGLPTHADVPVPAANLSACNVLTLRPDLSSLRVLPYAPRTAMVMCTAHNQRNNELSPLCTRGLLERVLHEARVGMGIQFCVGAELEFQLFHSTLKDGKPQPIDSSTFANSISLNEQEDFISALYDQLTKQDIPIELIHAESAPGQLEVVLSYSSNVTQLADDIVMARETISSCAKTHGMKALFLPKTSLMTAGNGLHLHFSFRNIHSSLDNAFMDATQTTGISLRGQSFIEGILSHLPSLLSFSLPTTNSFRRMGPGCWTGSSVGWSIEDKEVPLRVCLDLSTQESHATNVEYKLSDATANVYLELAMILAAGMDGIKYGKKLRPMASEHSIEPLPTTLQDSLDMLKSNDTLLNILGPELSTAYFAVRESMLQLKSSIDEEVMDAFNKA